MQIDTFRLLSGGWRPERANSSFSSPTSAPLLEVAQTPAGQRRHVRQSLRLRAPRRLPPRRRQHQQRFHRLLQNAAASSAKPRKSAPAPKPASSTTPRCAPGQAENYARHLPADEGRPPFRSFSRCRQRHRALRRIHLHRRQLHPPFPDPRSHRIRLDDLARPEIRPASRPHLARPA